MIGGMPRQQKRALLLTVFCALAGLAPDAQAYLDPSTGSMILSAIVGLFATIGLALKTYWYRLRRLLGRRPAADSVQEEAAGIEAERAGASPGSSQGSATGAGPDSRQGKQNA